MPESQELFAGLIGGSPNIKKRVIEVDNMIAECLDFQVKAYQLPNFF